MIPGAATDDCRCRLNFNSGALHGLWAMMQTVESAYIQHSERLPESTSHHCLWCEGRAKWIFRGTTNNIISYFISPAHENEMSKCDTNPGEKLDKRNNLIKQNTSSEKREFAPGKTIHSCFSFLHAKGLQVSFWKRPCVARHSTHSMAFAPSQLWQAHISAHQMESRGHVSQNIFRLVALNGPIWKKHIKRHSCTTFWACERESQEDSWVSKNKSQTVLKKATAGS